MKIATIICASSSKCVHARKSRAWHTKLLNGSWIEVRDIFCSAFFPLSRICALRTEILTFRQNDKESIGVAWARFTLLVKSGPDLSLPKHLLLQNFYAGLDKESAHHLDLTSGGSFAHLIPTESREVLDKILDRTSFVCTHRARDASSGTFRNRIETLRKPISGFDLGNRPWT